MAGQLPERQAIRQFQLERLRALLAALCPANPFYTRKLQGIDLKQAARSVEDYSRLVPFTTKQELAADQQATGPFGTNLTFPLTDYTRCHQTSGTGGAPLRWLDTPESWQWMVGTWQQVHSAAGVTNSDRMFFAFSFGPFIGFWLAFEAASKLGCLCLSGGGLSTSARVHAILDQGATALCCTPSYAIRLAEVAAGEGINLSARSRVRLILVAGEPGGSVPATRAKIERLWPGAQVFDHHGMTEIGPVTFQCPKQPGVLHVLESSFFAEVVDAATAGAGELVLTNLGRTASPLLRYRTGDLVRPIAQERCVCGRHDLALAGGILGRVDEMVVVRGVNVYPTAVEEIVRSTPETVEYQVVFSQEGALTEMGIKVELDPACNDPAGVANRLQKAFERALSLRVPVEIMPSGALPRFEMKAKRWGTGPVKPHREHP